MRFKKTLLALSVTALLLSTEDVKVPEPTSIEYSIMRYAPGHVRLQNKDSLIKSFNYSFESKNSFEMTVVPEGLPTIKCTSEDVLYRWDSIRVISENATSQIKPKTPEFANLGRICREAYKNLLSEYEKESDNNISSIL